eukprot:TRINITY_DN7922_c0_g1_i2.p1 TRINITY_DN7922_c0_g1~~TRINITY_DN7922_c0_g1_i2.p1  ORF type:complete len:267 (-),score=57.30 TRINITY_DN7922_c0_g1_i2:324-1124(-)
MLKGGLWSGFDEWRGRTIRSNYAENKERAKGAAVRLLRNCVLRVIRCETQAAVVQWRCRRYDGALETISEAVREREATLEDEVKRVTKQVYAAGEAAHSGRVGMLETELLQGRQAQMKLEASLKQQIEIVARMETSRWDREGEIASLNDRVALLEQALQAAEHEVVLGSSAMQSRVHNLEGQLEQALGQVREVTRVLKMLEVEGGNPSERDAKHARELWRVKEDAFQIVTDAEQCVIRTEKIAEKRIRDLELELAFQALDSMQEAN